MTTVDLTTLGVKDVLRLYGAILKEMRRREITTTNDGPIGGYGEWLVARAFNGVRKANSSKGFDVLADDGLRLQVKTRWLPLGTELRQLSAIRKLEEAGFDFIVAVLLDEDFDVGEAYQIPHGAVARLTSRAELTNSRRLVLTPRVCRDADCRDITAKLRAADREIAGAVAAPPPAD
ncbi:MAG TPA: hypothetical protein VI056_05635 [Candidatus Limnocylindria bacterium]